MILDIFTFRGVIMTPKQQQLRNSSAHTDELSTWIRTRYYGWGINSNQDTSNWHQKQSPKDFFHDFLKLFGYDQCQDMDPPKSRQSNQLQKTNPENQRLDPPKKRGHPPQSPGFSRCSVRVMPKFQAISTCYAGPAHPSLIPRELGNSLRIPFGEDWGNLREYSSPWTPPLRNPITMGFLIFDLQIKKLGFLTGSSTPQNLAYGCKLPPIFACVAFNFLDVFQIPVPKGPWFQCRCIYWYAWSSWWRLIAFWEGATSIPMYVVFDMIM